MQAYLDIPWEAEGCSPTGCSCWGLLQLYYRQEYGIVLPPVTEADTMRKDLHRVAKARAGDILVFRDGPNRRHVAIALDERDMLHVDECKPSCIERYRDFTWRHRLLSIYRHRMLA